MVSGLLEIRAFTTFALYFLGPGDRSLIVRTLSLSSAKSSIRETKMTHSLPISFSPALHSLGASHVASDGNAAIRSQGNQTNDDIRVNPRLIGRRVGFAANGLSYRLLGYAESAIGGGDGADDLGRSEQA